MFPDTEIGDRVLVGAITPCGQCRACLSSHLSQCGREGYEALGGCASATRSTALRLNISRCLMRRLTSQKFLMSSLTNKWSCSLTLPRPVSVAPSRRT